MKFKLKSMRKPIVMILSLTILFNVFNGPMGGFAEERLDVETDIAYVYPEDEKIEEEQVEKETDNDFGTTVEEEEDNVAEEEIKEDNGEPKEEEPEDEYGEIVIESEDDFHFIGFTPYNGDLVGGLPLGGPRAGELVPRRQVGLPPETQLEPEPDWIIGSASRAVLSVRGNPIQRGRTYSMLNNTNENPHSDVLPFLTAHHFASAHPNNLSISTPTPAVSFSNISGLIVNNYQGHLAAVNANNWMGMSRRLSFLGDSLDEINVRFTGNTYRQNNYLHPYESTRIVFHNNGGNTLIDFANRRFLANNVHPTNSNGQWIHPGLLHLGVTSPERSGLYHFSSVNSPVNGMSSAEFSRSIQYQLYIDPQILPDSSWVGNISLGSGYTFNQFLVPGGSLGLFPGSNNTGGMGNALRRVSNSAEGAFMIIEPMGPDAIPFNHPGVTIAHRQLLPDGTLSTIPGVGDYQLLGDFIGDPIRARQRNGVPAGATFLGHHFAGGGSTMPELNKENILNETALIPGADTTSFRDQVGRRFEFATDQVITFVYLIPTISTVDTIVEVLNEEGLIDVTGIADEAMNLEISEMRVVDGELVLTFDAPAGLHFDGETRTGVEDKDDYHEFSWVHQVPDEEESQTLHKTISAPAGWRFVALEDGIHLVRATVPLTVEMTPETGALEIIVTGSEGIVTDSVILGSEVTIELIDVNVGYDFISWEVVGGVVLDASDEATTLVIDVDATEVILTAVLGRYMITSPAELTSFIRGEAPYHRDEVSYVFNAPNGVIDMSDEPALPGRSGIFTGDLIGQAHTILNLQINSTPNMADIGMLRETAGFVEIRELTFENLTVRNEVNAAGVGNQRMNGGIVARATGEQLTIDQVRINGLSVETVAGHINARVGGLIGQVLGNTNVVINDTFVEGQLYSLAGNGNFGGLIGEVVGANPTVEVNGAEVVLDVRTDGGYYTLNFGGFIGRMENGTLRIEYGRSNPNSPLHSIRDSYASRGGFVGQLVDVSATIHQSVHEGRLHGYNEIFVGGFVGSISDGRLNITESYNIGVLSQHNTAYPTAGFLSLAEAGAVVNISDSYHIGSSDGTGVIGIVRDGATAHLDRVFVAGFAPVEPISLARENITASHVYWDSSVLNRTTSNGVGQGISTTRLIRGETGITGGAWLRGFAGAELSDNTDLHMTYPYLSWQTAGTLATRYFDNITPNADASPVATAGGGYLDDFNIEVLYSQVPSLRLFNLYNRQYAINSSNVFGSNPVLYQTIPSGYTHAYSRGDAPRFSVGLINNQNVVGFTVTPLRFEQEERTDVFIHGINHSVRPKTIGGPQPEFRLIGDLPTGLIFDTNTGEISGIATNIEDIGQNFNVMIEAFNEVDTVELLVRIQIREMIQLEIPTRMIAWVTDAESKEVYSDTYRIINRTHNTSVTVRMDKNDFEVENNPSNIEFNTEELNIFLHATDGTNEQRLSFAPYADENEMISYTIPRAEYITLKFEGYYGGDNLDHVRQATGNLRFHFSSVESE